MEAFVIDRTTQLLTTGNPMVRETREEIKKFEEAYRKFLDAVRIWKLSVRRRDEAEARDKKEVKEINAFNEDYKERMDADQIHTKRLWPWIVVVAW